MNPANTEDILDPQRDIVDCHHHLWDRPGSRYLVDAFLADAGHRISQSVFIQCRTGYRHGSGESPALETAAIVAMTRASQQSGTQVAAGIVGYADMLAGERCAALLDAHLAAGEGRFKGVRHIVSWAAGEMFRVEGYPTRPGMLGEPAFGAAMRELARRDLAFEAMVFHTQLDELARMAAAHDRTRIILNHIGIPLGIGPFSGQQERVMQAWRRGLHQLAACPNVYLKLGGMGMHYLGLHAPRPASSRQIAACYQPYIEICVEAFGAERCMFESNFPVDAGQCDYRKLWNAFKHASARYSEHEKTQLFSGTARACYRLN